MQIQIIVEVPLSFLCPDTLATASGGQASSPSSASWMLGAVSKSSINLKESQMKLFLNTSQIHPKTSLQTLLQNIFLKLLLQIVNFPKCSILTAILDIFKEELKAWWFVLGERHCASSLHSCLPSPASCSAGWTVILVFTCQPTSTKTAHSQELEKPMKWPMIHK